jgi:hydroxyethylthiazole kinase
MSSTRDETAFGAAAIAATLAAVRARRPLIHNMANAVVANSTANALLALGASPAMVDGIEEVAAFSARADALVVNLGTMSGPRAAAIRLAAECAHARGLPWVMDPVAVGVLSYRTERARELLALRPTAIRGNASEVMALAGGADGGKGVDSAAGSEAAIGVARDLSARTGAVVAVTGAVDYVTDGLVVVACRNGHAMMTWVTGLGCTATAIVGACLAVEPDALVATSHALALIGMAGEIAAAASGGPGSLQVGILDALYAMDASVVGERARLGIFTDGRAAK